MPFQVIKRRRPEESLTKYTRSAESADRRKKVTRPRTFLNPVMQVQISFVWFCRSQATLRCRRKAGICCCGGGVSVVTDPGSVLSVVCCLCVVSVVLCVVASGWVGAVQSSGAHQSTYNFCRLNNFLSYKIFSI